MEVKTKYYAKIPGDRMPDGTYKMEIHYMNSEDYGFKESDIILDDDFDSWVCDQDPESSGYEEAAYDLCQSYRNDPDGYDLSVIYETATDKLVGYVQW